MKKLMFFTILMCAIASVAHASEIEPKIVYDYSNNEVWVSADAGETEKRVSLQILHEGYDFDDLSSTQEDVEKILYVKQADGVSGKFTFIVSYGEELEAGLHNARLVIGDKSVDIEGIKLISAEIFETAIADINEYAKTQNYPKFEETLYNECENLGFDDSILKKLKSDNCIKDFMTDVYNNPLSDTDSITNIKRFNTFMLMGALEDGVLDNADELMRSGLLFEDEIFGEYEELIVDKEEQEFVTEKMSGKEYSTLDDVKTGLKEAILLNEIYYAEGYEDVQNIISEYGEIAGITSDVSKTVAKGLMGKEFDSVEDLLEACEDLEDEKSETSGGGGGGPVSSGNKKNSVSGTYTAPVTSNKQEAVKKNAFTDIEGVDWAVESINALYDKGIVAGRTEELFEPNEPITREEFVKLLVCALSYQNEAYAKNVFSDVPDTAWYVSYVNIAYEKNLVNGIGNNMFGSGMLITRQDMSVMIYNALKSEGVDCKVSDFVFRDADKIADYAKEAVGVLYEKGIINGVSETEFDPMSQATRAQAAKIIYGVLQNLN